MFFYTFGVVFPAGKICYCLQTQHLGLAICTTTIRLGDGFLNDTNKA